MTGLFLILPGMSLLAAILLLRLHARHTQRAWREQHAEALRIRSFGGL